MIKIYTKTTCPYCDMAKKLLEQFGFEYQSVNIEQNSDARDWLLNEGHKSVPQIYVNDQLIVGGFNGLQSVGKSGVQSLLEG